MKSKADEADNYVWYFGYGPMVHPSVRQRRGLTTTEEQPAVLRNYRLSFAFGGVATLVQKTGYDVHGILMKLPGTEAWNTLKTQEAGFVPVSIDVVPYAPHKSYSDNEDESTEHSESPVPCGFDFTDPLAFVDDGPAICASTFVMEDFKKLDLYCSERLPQERYLRLIAEGMSIYEADDEYVRHQILEVPFTPTRKPHEYETFPVLPSLARTLDGSGNDGGIVLPSISLDRYQRYCREQLQQHVCDSSERNDPTRLCFVVGRHVVLVAEAYDIQHAGASFLREHGFGKDDITFQLQSLVVEPTLPCCQSPADVSEPIQKWAENHLTEFICKGLTCHRVAVVVYESLEESEDIANTWKSILSEDNHRWQEVRIRRARSQSPSCGSLDRGSESAPSIPVRDRRRSFLNILADSAQRRRSSKESVGSNAQESAQWSSWKTPTERRTWSLKLRRSSRSKKYKPS